MAFESFLYFDSFGDVLSSSLFSLVVESLKSIFLTILSTGGDSSINE